jgi:uncharacterized protein DUF3223
MREPVEVGGETFPTKGALEERLQGMLHAAEPGVEFDEPEHGFLLCVLFRHPDAVEKIGPGVRAFRVTTTQYKNRCFEVVRVDGSGAEFSYARCVRGGGDGDALEPEEAARGGGEPPPVPGLGAA